MAESEIEITKEELQKEIADILDNASLDKTSTKKVIQKLEKKLGVDLTEKKKMIDQLVMDYVNSMDSEDEDSAEEEPPVKVAPKKTKIWKKQDDDEEDEEHDDSNDSDWGCQDGHLLDGDSTDESYHHHHHPLPQEPTVTTSSVTYGPNCSRNGLILKRVAPATHEEDEADIFGKLTAKKLRKLTDEQRDSMMIEINQLFYDISYKHDQQSDPPKPRMVDKFTSMPPTIQIEAKKIFRVNSLPSHLMSPSNLVASCIPIAPAKKPRSVVKSRVPKTVVPPSNVPEPVVQEAATPKQVVAPANEKASENNVGLFCDLM